MTKVSSPGKVARQLLDHLLDEEMAEGDAAQALLAVGDRVEDRGRGLFRVERLALLGEDRPDGRGNLAGQRHLDEDQGVVDQGRVEEGVEPAIRRVDAPPEILPAVDPVHGLVG
ncbi:MAG: hypothetical protein R3D28_06955 [Geminicoccaceae bacterium]